MCPRHCYIRMTFKTSHLWLTLWCHATAVAWRHSCGGLCVQGIATLGWLSKHHIMVNIVTSRHSCGVTSQLWRSKSYRYHKSNLFHGSMVLRHDVTTQLCRSTYNYWQTLLINFTDKLYKYNLINNLMTHSTGKSLWYDIIDFRFSENVTLPWFSENATLYVNLKCERKM